MDDKEVFSIAIDEIKKEFPKIKGIYVFGSFAKKEHNDNSDLDIAILLDKPADTVTLWNVSQNIASRIQRDVDLIDLLAASTVFRFQIISTAKRIDTLNLKTCDAFEDLTYGMYIRLNDERKEILDDIKERGRIY